MLTLEDVQKRMEKLKEWALEGDSITKDFIFPDFKGAMEFIDKIKEIAEKMNHHPLMMIDFNHVRLSLTTHESGGLSELDFDMAEAIDAIN